MEEKKNITCGFCNHNWKTASVLKYVTCPSCRNKVLNPHAKISKGN